MLSAERKEHQMADLREILLGNCRSTLMGRTEGEGDGSKEEKGGEGEGGVGEGEGEGEEVEMLIEEWLLKVRTYVRNQKQLQVHCVAVQFRAYFLIDYSHQNFIIS